VEEGTVVPTWSKKKPKEKSSTLEESGVEAGRNQEETGVALLTDKRCIPLRSASVRTPHLFHHGILKVLVNPQSKVITSVQSTSMH
jgi:hypothetical protein